MHSHRIIWVLLLAGLLLMNLYLNNGYALLLLAAAVLIPLVSVLFCVLSRKSLSVLVEGPELVTKGDYADLTAVLRSHSVWTAALVAANASIVNPLTGTNVERKVSFLAVGRGERRQALTLSDAEVGKLYISLTDLRVQDLFRLVSFRVADNQQLETLVFPKEVPVSLELAEPLETQGESLRFSEHEPGRDVTEVYDIRDYVPGDDIRAVHWNLSARQDRTILRQFSKPLNYSVMLLGELAPAAPAALEACATYLAAVSRALLGNGIVHTMAWYDRGTDDYVNFNITGEDELQLAVLRLISSCVGETEDASLRRYMASAEANRNTTLIDLTTSLKSDLLLRAALAYPSRFFFVGSAEEEDAAEGLSVDVLPVRISDHTALELEV